MAIGWTDDDAVLDQIQDSVNDEVNRARRNVPCGESLLYCEECGEEIPEARRRAIPGVRLCIDARKRRTNRTKPSVFTTAAVQKTASSNNFLSFNYSLIKLF